METEAFNAFTPILDKGGVDVLFCGHVHYYNRRDILRAFSAPRSFARARVARFAATLLGDAGRRRRRPHRRLPARHARRYMPYDAATGQVDTASVSADGSVYSSPKYMVTIVTGASGDIEHDDAYTKQSPSFTGTENYG